jgi:hypothetical protein
LPSWLFFNPLKFIRKKEKSQKKTVAGNDKERSRRENYANYSQEWSGEQENSTKVTVSRNDQKTS